MVNTICRTAGESMAPLWTSGVKSVSERYYNNFLTSNTTLFHGGTPSVCKVFKKSAISEIQVGTQVNPSVEIIGHRESLLVRNVFWENF